MDDYAALAAAAERGRLGEGDRARLELLQDVLLEAGVRLDALPGRSVRRQPRAVASVRVSFHTAGEMATAISRDIGGGGLAVVTKDAPPVGTVVPLEIHVDEWAEPLRVRAEVVWERAGAMGVAFRDLSPEDRRRLESFVVKRASLLERVRAALSKRPAAPVQAEVTTRPLVILALSDATLAAASAEVLELEGFAAQELPGPPDGVALVADAERALAAQEKLLGVPLVLVNISGPDALAGRLTSLKVAAFVKRPATPRAVLDAVARVALERPSSARPGAGDGVR